MTDQRRSLVEGDPADRNRAECLAAGMNDLLPKPFQIEKLRLALIRWSEWIGE